MSLVQKSLTRSRCSRQQGGSTGRRLPTCTWRGCWVSTLAQRSFPLLMGLTPASPMTWSRCDGGQPPFTVSSAVRVSRTSRASQLSAGQAMQMRGRYTFPLPTSYRGSGKSSLVDLSIIVIRLSSFVIRQKTPLFLFFFFPPLPLKKMG